MLAVFAGFLFGVDLGSIGAAIDGMSKEMELDKKEVEWVVSGAKGGAIFGSFFGGALIMSRGRRTIIGWAGIPAIAGPLLMFTANSLGQLIVGRVLMGLGIGLASVATPSYLSEVALPEQRGTFEAMYELGIATGMLFAAMANAGIEMSDADPSFIWRCQAGLVPCLFAIPVLIVVCTVPESPRWRLLVAGSNPIALLQVLQDVSALERPGARERLKTVHLREGFEERVGSLDPEDSDDSEDELDGHDDDLIRLWDEKHLAAGLALFKSDELKEESEAARLHTLPLLWRTLSDTYAIIRGAEQVPAGARQGLALALSAAVLDQACASTSILIYTQKILEGVGVGQEAQDLLTTLVVAAKLFGVIMGLIIVERVPRRVLLGAGGGLSAVALSILVLGASLSSPSLLLTGMIAFVGAFYCTWGIGYWVVVVEVTAVGGPRYASAAQSVSTATLFAAGWLTSLTFMDVVSVGTLGLLIYVAVAVAMCLFAFCLLPETAGHSLEECAGDILHEEPVADGATESDTSQSAV